MAKKKNKEKLPKIGMLYLDYVLRFFDKSNFRGWPDKIETVTYHWKNDKDRFVKEVKRKKIDILIGNIPATAYETFREIARELPNVQFIPSLDTQFSNKSKENVTRFAWKYDIPIPKTYIYYDKDKADNFIEDTEYPKIIKKSYGPSNYGGYFVHKVDSKQEARNLLAQKKYHPAYFQDFVPMEADVRVMLIGHKPVCAFWRRAPEGEWLTNTSQGGSMDYMDVPKELLDLAVSVSKAANAEYWACDVAVGADGKYRILECATAFAAFPYIRDWIGQYLMWKFSNGRFPKPNIPLFNWEELGKMDPSVLRTLRYITFGKYTPSYDGAYFLDKKVRETEEGEMYLHELDALYPMLLTEDRTKEEWPSEKWNFQDNYGRSVRKVHAQSNPKVKKENDSDESSENIEQEDMIVLTEKKVKKLLTSVEGIGKKKAEKIMDKFDTTEIVHALETAPHKLMEEVSWFKKKFLTKLMENWEELKSKLK
jgi:glutathione synthase/RimK-type ligase-like ATP-grasp enzyme